ncbi:site-specific DNA-methyltransferase [Zhongshania guokunii]|uniref:site-specific DNA-methyltransferase (adenine-specific) n=1 Tax=Zhongshania guokunii TaxID=641783 RepID=A0ABV3U668_9GAMM
MLHWANKDQYYIKSSETLRDYSFRLNPQAGLCQDPMRVHFKLVDADAGAKDNNKESDDNKRVFVLDADTPFELIDGEPNEDGERHQELQLRFFFRPATSADWSDKAKSKASAAAQKKPPTQEHLRAIAEERLLGELGQLPAPWNVALGRLYTKANGERADYSTLQGQLNNYTKKNTFDYFIHKDLGGFLTRELDFYVKNELMDWSDIAALKHDPARLAPLLSKIEVIRNLGEKIISFLAQLENFQKKLWLKKKFVTGTHYCLTLDRIEQHPAMLEEVFNNDRQKQDWTDLYKLDLTQLEKDLATAQKCGGYSALLAEPKYRYLMLDTANFDEAFLANMLSTIEDLDEQCDGLLVHSENYQALNLLQDRYRGQVQCIYIDPPYNTGSDGFAYKDSYKSSSWMTMMESRLALSSKMLSELGVIFTSINEIERSQLERALASVFGDCNRVEELIWVQDTVSNNAPAYSTNHEYIQVFAKNKDALLADKLAFREIRAGYKEVSELAEAMGESYAEPSQIEDELKRLYKRHKEEHIASEQERGIEKPAAEKSDPWKGIYPYCNVEYRTSSGSKVEVSQAKELGANPWVWRKVEPSMPSGKQSQTTKESESDNYRYYSVQDPVTGKEYPAPKRGWVFPKKTVGNRPSFESYVCDDRIWFGLSGIPQQKYFLHEVGLVVATSIVNQYADGEPYLERYFGKKGLVSNPKPPALIERLLRQVVRGSGVVMDFFAGSGTTGQSVIDANRKDQGNRGYLLIEAESYFHNVLKPRVIKSAYCKIWEQGKPSSSSVRDTAASHSFKYIFLESYEDTLGNLALNRPSGQQSLLDASDESPLKQARQAYVMNYMLEVESRGSASLLNTAQFLDPTRYQLNVRSAGGDETKAVNVDLLETFNYLLGLRVEHIAAPLHFDAEFSQGEYGRLQAKVNRSPEGKWWFRTVYGKNANGQSVLVVWRNLPSVIAGGDDGMQRDNAVLDAVLIEKLKIRLTESADDEIDILYVNGDHNIAIPRDRKGQAMEQARLQLIEETFHRLMFAGSESVQ